MDFVLCIRHVLRELAMSETFPRDHEIILLTDKTSSGEVSYIT